MGKKGNICFDSRIKGLVKEVRELESSAPPRGGRMGRMSVGAGVFEKFARILSIDLRTLCDLIASINHSLDLCVMFCLKPFFTFLVLLE